MSTSTTFKCLCGKQESWIDDSGTLTKPCPECGRLYKGVFSQEDMTIIPELVMTSAQWNVMCPITILDHDGWDRNNFDYSWYEEQITLEEFNNRVMRSTIQM